MAAINVLKVTAETTGRFAAKLKIAEAYQAFENELWTDAVDLAELVIHGRLDLLEKARERDLIGECAAKYLFSCACENGQTAIAQFLDRVYFAHIPITKHPIVYTFELSAAGGYLETLQWQFALYTERKFDGLYPNFEPSCQAMEGATRGGHTNIISWLLETFEACRKELKMNDFIACCVGGHLEAAQYIADRLSIGGSSKVNGSDICRALVEFPYVGSLDGVKWLLGRVNWTQANFNEAVKKFNWHPITRAAHGGHLELVKWWVNFCGLDNINDPEGELELALGAACDAGHLAIATWLADFGGISRKRGFLRSMEHIEQALRRRDYRMAEWLHKRFGC